MAKSKWVTLIGTILVVSSPHAGAQSWTEILNSANLSRTDLTFDALDLRQVEATDQISPIYYLVHDDPLRIPFFARTFREAILANAHQPFEIGLTGLNRVGLSPRRLPNKKDRLSQIEAGQTTAFEAIGELQREAGHPLDKAAQKGLRSALRHLAPELDILVAKIISSETLSYKIRQQALAGFGDPTQLRKAFAELNSAPPTGPEPIDVVMTPTARRMIQTIDLRQLMLGGMDLIHLLQSLRTELMSVKITHHDRFLWKTPLGWIEVNTNEENNTYPNDRPYLLILDAFGDDTYFGGGGSYDSDHPISVLIDLQGNDQYLESAVGTEKPWAVAQRKSPKSHPAFGAGLLGYGILWDLRGDDIYSASRQTEGRGHYGVGLLWDESGRNQFRCWVQCQGSADFGLGLLLDTGTNDLFSAMQMAQGFGGTRGAGLLVKPGEGSDHYLGIDDPVDFPSEVAAKHAENFVQGAALGLRADYTDGHSLGGGFGALVDGGGDNEFKAGFFAQGVGYWYGVGLLSTGEGKDQYLAGKYAQGAGIHFAVGILHDGGGDDFYQVDQELGQGHGHDFGVGFLLDDGGNDTYRAPNFSLGCASAQGIGIFWDRKGNDTYTSEAPDTLGCATPRIVAPSLRFHSRTTGIFIDSDGTNTFNTKLEKPKGQVKNAGWLHFSHEVPTDAKASLRAKFTGFGRVLQNPGLQDPE